MLVAVPCLVALALILAFLCVTRRGLVSPAMGFVLRLSGLLGRLRPVARSPEARRAKNDSDCAIAGSRIKGVSSKDLEIAGPGGGIGLRIYRREGAEPSKVLLFIHGGGWVLSNVEAADPVARLLCRDSGALVISVEYRLAPEHLFPAAIEDVVAAYKWILGEVAAGRMPSGGIFVAGDSAGGNLAAALCLDARAGGLGSPAGQILFYPALDLSRTDSASYGLYGEAYMLSREDMEWFIAAYIPDAAQRVDPLASPLLAPDLAGLPPALIVTAEYDVLRDEGEAYAGRLRAAGVRAESRRFRGMVHGFLSMGRFVGSAGRASVLAAGFIRGA